MRGSGRQLGRPFCCRLPMWPEASRSHLRTSSFSTKDSRGRAGVGWFPRNAGEGFPNCPGYPSRGPEVHLRKRDPSLGRQDGKNDRGSSHTGGNVAPESPFCCQGVGELGQCFTPFLSPELLISDSGQGPNTLAAVTVVKTPSSIPNTLSQ